MKRKGEGLLPTSTTPTKKGKGEKITYLADRVFDGESLLDRHPITVSGGRVVAHDPDAEVIRLKGTLVPGFVDVQVNGGGGLLFNHEPTVATVRRIAEAHSKYGTTALLPTLITDKLEVIQRAADAIASALREGVPGVIGVHFEGPHLSVPKKGVHEESLIRPMSEAEFSVYARQDLGLKVVTVAPETVTGDEIRRLVEVGVKVCIGHTNASFSEATAAIEAGATGFTHLFNAMSPFNSRAPGVVGAALWDDNTWCGLIADGHHVCDISARLAIRAKKSGKIMLVTDSMALVGSTLESFDLFGKTVKRGEEGKHTLTTGELAGSMLDMTTAVRNTVQNLKIPLAESLRMGSLYPAQFLGVEDTRGRLQEGHRADFVLLDEGLHATATYIAGEITMG